MIEKINPILRGWMNYFRVGQSRVCFRMVKQWVARKVRQHLMRARGRKGYGWKRWSSAWLYEQLGLFDDYRLVPWSARKSPLPDWPHKPCHEANRCAQCGKSARWVRCATDYLRGMANLTDVRRASYRASYRTNVTMVSHSSIAPRRIPQQKRGKRRVDGFLRAAASVIAEMGYERATMSAIAQRSHSSVGSLYQFFPNKLALAEALRNQYVKNVEQSWITIGRQATDMSAEDLTRRVVELQIEIIKNHPVLLALLDVPPASQARRELIRARIAEVLISHKPRMSRATALRIASVVQQVSRGLLSLYAQAGAGERIAIIDEFKSVLTGYLVPKLKS